MCVNAIIRINTGVYARVRAHARNNAKIGGQNEHS